MLEHKDTEVFNSLDLLISVCEPVQLTLASVRVSLKETHQINVRNVYNLGNLDNFKSPDGGIRRLSLRDAISTESVTATIISASDDINISTRAAEENPLDCMSCFDTGPKQCELKDFEPVR